MVGSEERSEQPTVSANPRGRSTARPRPLERRLLVLVISSLVPAWACQGPRLPPNPEVEALEELSEVSDQVIAVLDRQVEAWNRGDIDGFMSSYWRSPDLRFTSGGTVERGFQQTLERYRRTYPDRAAMGTLSFEELDVRVLSEAAVLVFGRFRLRREVDEPTGYFTLLVERHADDWRIVADHTSS